MELLKKHFDLAFAAPDSVQKLRELILTLAMQGKLVPQDPKDQPASELLKEIEAEKQRLVEKGTFRDREDLEPSEIVKNFIIPKNWERCTIQNLGFVLGGKRLPNGHNYSEFPTAYRYLTVTNMKNKTIINKEIKYIKPETYAEISKYVITKNDLYITIAGTIGAVGSVPESCDGMNLTENAAKLVFSKCDKTFLVYLLNSKVVQDQFAALTNKMAQPKLSLRSILSTLIPLPPLVEQRRIVTKIDRLMARCDELEKLRGDRNQKRITIHTAALNRLLTAKESSDFSTAWRFITQHFGELYSVKENVAELRKAILQLAVMGKLVPQDPKDEPASELLKAIAAEKQQLVKEGKIKQPKPLPDIKPEEMPYELPKGWQWSNIQNISLKVTDGEHATPQRSESGYYLLSARNVTNEGIKLDNVDYVPQHEYERIRKRCDPEIGDILISCSGSVGRIAIVDANDYVMVRSAALIKHEHNFLMSSFLAYALKSPMVQFQIVEKSRTTAQSNLFLGKINEILIPIPPLVEQRRIVAKIDQLMALCDHLDQQIDAAKNKQTTLLNAVMAQV